MGHNPEEITLKKERREKIDKKVRQMLEVTYKYLKKEHGLPVNADLRIGMENFKGIIGENEINSDLERIIDKEKQFGLTAIQGDKIAFTAGEILEIFKTAILNSILNKRYLVIRASKYDDYFNGVDNIILDKNSGEVIAAIDDVADLTSSRFYNKKNEIIKINLESGVKIKYGIGLTGEEKTGEIIPVANLYGLPIFYIAIAENILFELVEKFGEYTDKEKMKILDWIVKLIELLISEIELKLGFQRTEYQNQNELRRLNERLNKLRNFKEELRKTGGID